MSQQLPIIAVVVFFVCPNLSASADDEIQAKALARLQGTWKSDSWIIGGKPENKYRLRSSYRVEDKKMILIEDGRDDGAAEIKINSRMKPHHIDISYKTGALKGKTLLGIYKFSDAKFINCFAPPGDERPREFTSTKENQYFLSVDRRINANADEPGDEPKSR